MAFIVLGHASEKHTRHKVPPGCTLVLTEECGMTSVFPYQIYPTLADPSITAMFADPISHKETIESILKRPIRIYPPGTDYPELSYTLLSETENVQVGPSGFYALPTPNFVFQPDKRGEARYLTKNVDLATTGSLLHHTQRVTQSTLFERYPGVHYSLLCRVIEEEERMKTLIRRHFSKQTVDDIFTVEGDDPFKAASIWLSHVEPRTNAQREAVTDIGRIVADVTERRRASGSPLEEQPIMAMLAMRRLPPSALATIADLKDVDRPDRRNGYTPLMMAALMGHRSAVSALVERGANVHAKDNEGSTPLMFACTSGDPAIVQMMLECEADPRPASDDGVTALHIAAANHSMAANIRIMLARGADPLATDEEGDTPLHTAETAEIVEMLIGAGADPNRQNKEGLTPLMVALEEGDTETALALVPHTDLSIRSHGSALGYAIKAKQDKVAVALIEAGIPVASWTKVEQAARSQGLHDLERVARERRRRRRHTVKKSSSHRSWSLHEGGS